MSTSLLYHAFGIRGYQYTRTVHQGGQVTFIIHQDPQSCRCPACHSSEFPFRRYRVRTMSISSSFREDVHLPSEPPPYRHFPGMMTPTPRG